VGTRERLGYREVRVSPSHLRYRCSGCLDLGAGQGENTQAYQLHGKYFQRCHAPQDGAHGGQEFRCDGYNAGGAGTDASDGTCAGHFSSRRGGAGRQLADLLVNEKQPFAVRSNDLDLV
jgi:hypothetical protein